MTPTPRSMSLVTANATPSDANPSAPGMSLDPERRVTEPLDLRRQLAHHVVAHRSGDPEAPVPSDEEPAAVDDQGRAGHVAVPHQEQHGIGDVFGLSRRDRPAATCRRLASHPRAGRRTSSTRAGCRRDRERSHSARGFGRAGVRATAPMPRPPQPTRTRCCCLRAEGGLTRPRSRT